MYETQIQQIEHLTVLATNKLAEWNAKKADLIASAASAAAAAAKATANAPTALAALEHIIILGASLEAGAFGGTIDGQGAEVVAAQNRIKDSTGKTVTIHQRAVSGHNTANLVATQWPATKAAHGSLPGDGKTLVMIGIGGNDVSGIVPITTPNQTLINSKASIKSIITEIEAKGWDWCLLDLSWRDYNSPICQRDRTKGSWPWVTEVSRSINSTRNKRWGRAWTYTNGASWGDSYSFVRNNRQILAAGDAVHYTDDGYIKFRNELVDTVFIPAVTGLPAPQKFPRDETFELVFGITSQTVTGTSISIQTTSTHQGTAHIALYSSSANPTAAQVVAGNGTGFLSKVSAVRNGTTIDKPVIQNLSGPAANTAYKICAVFVSDAQQTSAVSTVNITTGAAVASTNPVVILFRQDSQTSPRANINTLTSAADVLSNGIKLQNAVDLVGTASGITLSVTAPFNQVNNTGNSGLSISNMFNAGELSESWYVDTSTAAITLSGLDPVKSYTLTFAASRNVPSTDATRTGDITITTGTVVNSGVATKVLNAANPSSGTVAPSVSFVVTPNVGGMVSFSLKRSSGNTTGFAYLGGLYIQPSV